MIKKLWVVEWTEYEQGWGQRPDGRSFYDTCALAMAGIEESNKHGTPECFWRGSTPRQVDTIEVNGEIRILD